jgi:hypothetical protein
MTEPPLRTEIRMATWKAFTEAAPELAAAVQARFGNDKHAVLATLRADGSPRVSGIETTFYDDLWLGGMPGGRKSADLRRDPRFALHSFTTAKEVPPGNASGDAKLSGRAVEATSEEKDAYVAQARARGDDVPDDLDFDLFRADVTEAVTIGVVNDELVIESWRPGQPVRRQTRT